MGKRERENDMRQRATDWNQTCGRCSEDTASGHVALVVFALRLKKSENLRYKLERVFERFTKLEESDQW